MLQSQGERLLTAGERDVAAPLMTIHWPHRKASAHCQKPEACSIVVKLMDLDPQGHWFDPWCGQDKICTAVGLLSEALNPIGPLAQGVCLLLSRINCKSRWIKASATLHISIILIWILCSLSSIQLKTKLFLTTEIKLTKCRRKVGGGHSIGSRIAQRWEVFC